MPTWCTKWTSFVVTSTRTPSPQLATCSRTTSSQNPSDPHLWSIGDDSYKDCTGFLIMPRPFTWRVQAQGCHPLDNADLGFAPSDLTAHCPVFRHRVTNLPGPSSVARSAQVQIRLSEPQASRNGNAFASALLSRLLQEHLPLNHQISTASAGHHATQPPTSTAQERNLPNAHALTRPIGSPPHSTGGSTALDGASLPTSCALFRTQWRC